MFDNGVGRYVVRARAGRWLPALFGGRSALISSYRTTGRFARPSSLSSSSPQSASSWTFSRTSGGLRSTRVAYDRVTPKMRISRPCGRDRQCRSPARSKERTPRRLANGLLLPLEPLEGSSHARPFSDRPPPSRQTVANDSSEPRYRVLVDGEEGDMTREFDDAIPVTEPLPDVFREVNPSSFVRRF